MAGRNNYSNMDTPLLVTAGRCQLFQLIKRRYLVGLFNVKYSSPHNIILRLIRIVYEHTNEPLNSDKQIKGLCILFRDCAEGICVLVVTL